jgi:hypothetical protein
MRVLSASDILYGRARFEIEAALANQEIVVEEGVPESQFLPDQPDYLDLSEVESALSATGGGSTSAEDCDENADDGALHGLELTSTTAQPAGLALTPDTSNSVAADGTDFEIAVTNGGDTTESGIDVDLGGDFTGSQTIDQIESGATETVTIPPRPAPKAGETASLEVTVATVCGEELETNNSSTYEITFE